MARRKGKFIVLEGPDKSGKSTQASLLTRAINESGRKAVHTREPGGSSVPFAEAIRGLLLDPAHRVHPLAELFLYEAARVQHTEELIRPALGRGETVVCERYTLATLAYQGFARGLPIPLVERLNGIATSGLSPDLTIVLDLPDSEFRKRDPGRELDRLERESVKFRKRVRDAYREAAKNDPKVVLVDATQPRHAVHVRILDLASETLEARVKPLPLEPAG